MAYASLHNWKRREVVFPTMQVLLSLLHSRSLAKTICRLPITGKLHYTSLDRGYAVCQSHPISCHTLIYYELYLFICVDTICL
jgi:hypothetical protein